jgi:DNA-binding NarL/FixJ family response regulator
VLRPLARGRSNKEIGPTLGISARTAGHHIAHIHDKIDASRRARAALFATEHGGFLRLV